MSKIKIQQTKSRIGRPKDQKRTLDALGLRKMNQVVEHNLTPQIEGMLKKINHLKIERIIRQKRKVVRNKKIKIDILFYILII